MIAVLERDHDRETGDYSASWDERNYLRGVDKVRASVFVVHGLNDWNVKTKHFGQWWDALAARNVPRKIWLHPANHNDPGRGRCPAPGSSRCPSSPPPTPGPAR